MVNVILQTGEIIGDKHLDLHKGIKTTGNSNYVSQYRLMLFKCP